MGALGTRITRGGESLVPNKGSSAGSGGVGVGVGVGDINVDGGASKGAPSSKGVGTLVVQVDIVESVSAVGTDKDIGRVEASKGLAA